MKRKMFRKLMAASLATAMTVSLAACGNSSDTPNTSSDGGNAPADETPAPSSDAPDASDVSSAGGTEDPVDEEPYPVLTDENGNVYDLGGMEIIIRDWWSSGDVPEPNGAFEEARQDWRDWAQETYHFTIKEQGFGDWDSNAQDFQDYASMADDGNNYVFLLHSSGGVTAALNNGLMYDLATLDCLDFSQKKFTKNGVHEMYSIKDSIYCMYAGDPEPRTGVFFNKRLLSEAGIEPEDIYDWQASGEWTWDKFEELLDKVQADTDNDGQIDVYGMTQNNSEVTNAAVWSNGGAYVGKESDGTFTYRLEDEATVEALNWAYDILNKYSLPTPADEPAWDWYQQAFKNGEAVFMTDATYLSGPNGAINNMEDDFGFVMFPKGPKMNDYVNCRANNFMAIPSCYDADKAWKIAFAYNLYTDDVPGYENYEGWRNQYYADFRDTRAVDETVAMMVEKGINAYHDLIADLSLGDDVTNRIYPGCDETVAQIIESDRDSWKSKIDAINNK